MDFNKFDSRAAADKGAWLHLRNPFDGSPIYNDGEPCEVLVYGAEGKVGLAAMEGARKALTGDASPNDAQVKSVRAIAPLIGGFRNIEKGGSPAVAPDDTEWFLSLQVSIRGDHPTFMEQVQTFAMKRANQLGNVQGG